MSKPSLRAYRRSDLDALARVYRDAIRHLGPAHYTPDQVRAWSGFADDTDAFRQWLEEPDTIVAIGETCTPIGFAGLKASGHVESLFVAPAAMRQGVASTLLAGLLDQARERGMAELTTAASEFSRPVFEKLGFEVAEVEHTDYKDVAFIRYKMRTRSQSP